MIKYFSIDFKLFDFLENISYELNAERLNFVLIELTFFIYSMGFYTFLTRRAIQVTALCKC
jgi:hypothetical protein